MFNRICALTAVKSYHNTENGSVATTLLVTTIAIAKNGVKWSDFILLFWFTLTHGSIRDETNMEFSMLRRWEPTIPAFYVFRRRFSQPAPSAHWGCQLISQNPSKARQAHVEFDMGVPNCDPLITCRTISPQSGRDERRTFPRLCVSTPGEVEDIVGLGRDDDTLEPGRFRAWNPHSYPTA